MRGEEKTGGDGKLLVETISCINITRAQTKIAFYAYALDIYFM